MEIENKDAKEFLENVGTEYRIGCYTDKKPEVCHMLAEFLETVKKDFDKASKVFRSTCDDYGFAKSCFKYGNYSFLRRGKGGTPASATEALTYYEKGCKLDNSESCLHAGLLLMSKELKSRNIEQDFPRGLDFLNKSCDMNNGTACFYLSGMHISGIERSEVKTNCTPAIMGADPKFSTVLHSDGDYVVSQDMEKAFNFAYKACELKNMYACANLSQMYARGDGTEQNPEKAEKFKKIAIDLQADFQNTNPIAFHQ